MTRAAVAALLAGAAVAGCGGGGEITTDELPSLVLQQEDLDGRFVRFDVGRIDAFDTGGSRRALDRFGRKGGWKARYRRAGTVATRGPLVVSSTVDLFESDDGAKRDLDAYRADLTRHAQVVDAPVIGDASVTTRRTQGSGNATVVFFTVAWRRGPTTASVDANGFGRRLTLGQTLELARAQDRRLTEAAAD